MHNGHLGFPPGRALGSIVPTHDNESLDTMNMPGPIEADANRRQST